MDSVIRKRSRVLAKKAGVEFLVNSNLVPTFVITMALATTVFVIVKMIGQEKRVKLLPRSVLTVAVVMVPVSMGNASVTMVGLGKTVTTPLASQWERQSRRHTRVLYVSLDVLKMVFA